MNLKNSMILANMMSKKPMPSRYQEVEYIESTGTQYIDTGIVPTTTTRVVTEIEVSTTTQDIPVFGCKDINAGQSTNSRYYHLTPNSNKWYFGTNNAQSNAGTYSNVVGTIYKIDFNNNQSIYIDGTEIASSINTTGNGNLCISARIGPSAKYGQFKYRSFIVYEGTTLVRNFIPVYDTETQKYGLWESVQGKFYGNDGTGDFKGSIVGYTVVGSPTITDGVVSGFSSANYLTLTLDKNVSNITEYVFKFKLTSEGLRNQYNYLFRRGNFQFSIYGSTTSFNIPNMYLPTYNQNVPLTDFVPIVDNWYWVKYTYDGTTVNLYSSIDGINWILRNTVTNVTVAGNSGTFYLGFADTNVNSYFGGTIDLNETYIKLNNKLWFNGQQA